MKIEIEGLKDLVVQAGGEIKQAGIIEQGRLATVDIGDAITGIKTYMVTEFQLVRNTMEEISAELQSLYESALDSLRRAVPVYGHQVYLVARQITLQDIDIEQSRYSEPAPNVVLGISADPSGHEYVTPSVVPPAPVITSVKTKSGVFGILVVPDEYNGIEGLQGVVLQEGAVLHASTVLKQGQFAIDICKDQTVKKYAVSEVEIQHETTEGITAVLQEMYDKCVATLKSIHPDLLGHDVWFFARQAVLATGVPCCDEDQLPLEGKEIKYGTFGIMVLPL